MKNKIKWMKRPSHFTLALLLVAILGIGSTIAYFTDVEAAVNRFTTGKIIIRTEEKVENLIKSDIGVTAEGISECYVRIRVDVPTVTYSYQDNGEQKSAGALITDANGKGMTAETWNELSSISVMVNRKESGPESAEWNKKDGFWYLSTTLHQGDSAELIKEITYPGLWDTEEGRLVDPLPEGVTVDMLTIPITSEAVQAEGIDVGGAAGSEAAYKAFQIVNVNGQ